ncbi:serine hydrolase domain-containing protein [Symbiobacterium terraclitae]|uniref:serine hydrolase domain-containing protein n=1 Tax=Symbiobacterium terraclitae TaxID=557451 RepID=UPI0035B54174
MAASDGVRMVVEQAAAPYLSRKKRMCVAVGVIRPDGQRMFHLGACTGGDGGGEDPIFEIGSVTKTFTTALLADLVADGFLALEDPVRKFLPGVALRPARDGSEVTLAHLATHTSGLPRLPRNLKVTRATRHNPYAQFTTAELLDGLSRCRPPARLPAPFEYSNLGMGLLGHILADVLGTDYEAAVRQRICGPLGMGDTGIALDAVRRRRLVPGHTWGGRPASNWDLPAIPGAGALRSTAADLLRFVAANLGIAGGVLAQRLARCHTPRAEVGGGAQIGLGWVIVPFAGDHLVWHNGATGGYNSFVGFVRGRGVGVCVLVNHTVPPTSAVGIGGPAADRIGVSVLKGLVAEPAAG